MASPNSTASQCLIVAIGASAGGLEAFEKFFGHLPPETGIAFVVVQHLSPDHESALPHLLGKYTDMPVEQVRDSTPILPDRTYIIPPNATLTVDHGALRITEPSEPRGYRTPIDSLFRTLAEDQGENAVCIILSGTGSDGTLGLRAIKENGGMAMAQTLDSAKYDAILRSAIATGLVDYVLPVEEMPARLLDYAAHLKSLENKPNGFRKEIGGQLSKITALLRRRAGHDFSQYKESTLARRIERRMKVLQIEGAEEYVAVLKKNPEELDLLFKDLLIGVTQFFRDPAAFDALAQNVIPKLFEGKGADDQVRVCIVGCASGEEAYSVAILLTEHLSKLDAAPEIKIFATDIDERGLELARKGIYPASVAEHVSAERLERFFTKQDNNAYQVVRSLREMCVFSAHSFIKDPPFSRLDLISCRNVIIYLGQELQRKLIPLFHYALRPGGYLFLGSSENTNSHEGLFRTLDKRHRIFQRKQSLPRPTVHFPLRAAVRSTRFGDRAAETEERSFVTQLERIILRRYSPACVVVKEDGEAVYFSGRTSRYLEQPPGGPERNVVNMAREGLRTPLRIALHRSATANERVLREAVPVRTNGEVHHIDLMVEPITDMQSAGLYIATFEESPQGEHESPHGTQAGEDSIVQHLEDELRSTQEHLQAAIEELQTSNEELRSANEEYQSTNEELETSKEELQSFNEELETVNSELNRKVGELDHSNSDLQNLLESTQIATIFLDRDCRIKSFTPAAVSVFRLIASDAGRPIGDIAPKFAEADFEQDVRQVLHSLIPKDRQLTTPQGRHYQMRILPYRTVHNVIEGVVVTFVDVTSLTQAEKAAKEAQAYAESIVATIREPLLILDEALRVRSANQAFYATFHTTPGETQGRFLFELGQGRWASPQFRQALNDLLERGRILEDFQIEYTSSDSERRIMRLNARRIGESQLILLAMLDVTLSENNLRRLYDDLRQFSYAASHDMQEPLRMVISYTQLLQREYKGRLDTQADQFISYAVEGAQRMERLLQDLRQYWSVSERKAEQALPVDCNQVLETATEFLRFAIQESGARITHESLPTILGEQVGLVLLFENLLSNAIKYRRPNQPPVIKISAEKGARDWTFSFQDNGIGIAAEYSEKIFVPFKRLHSRDYPGSGIGLAICKKIVEGFGGRIWVDSALGQGSTFHFTVPLADSESQPV